jgi:16S rRNA G966 N2-methylase RsmD
MKSLFDFHEPDFFKLENILNKRYSTRNMSDEQFEKILPTIAQELEKTSFYFSYTDQEMMSDWKKLCNWTTRENNINSTSRLGMKLSEHFCPNFYDIKNANGISYKSLWTATNLEKVLRWNRKSHSTPYLSEIKRGIYFNFGLVKNTMYRPQMSKMICDHYNAKSVLDPCAGWGGRMLGAVASGAHYYAFEPNTTTYNNLKKIIDFLEISDKVTIICDDALNMKNYDIPKVDLVITSPPYYDLEVYANESTQSITNHTTYESWAEDFLKGIVNLCIDHLNDTGISCWNVGKVSNKDMSTDIQTYHADRLFHKINEFSVVSSKRQMIKKKNNDKSSDLTIVYKKDILIKTP